MTFDRTTGAPVRRALVHTLCVAALLVFSFPEITQAQQTGTITGSVVDARTGEGLVGANVIVDNTLFGAAGEADGSFTIDEVPVGSYTLRARFIGFREAIEEVTVTANATTTVRHSNHSQPPLSSTAPPQRRPAHTAAQHGRRRPTSSTAQRRISVP